MSDKRRIVRFVPFLCLVSLSFCVAYGVTTPRKPFDFDLDLSISTLIQSLQKIQHFQASALVFAFAWIALGNRRLLVTLLLTIGVGFAWEVFEATALNHSARISDLAPDIIAAFSSYLLGVLIRRVLSQPTVVVETSRERRT